MKKFFLLPSIVLMALTVSCSQSTDSVVDTGSAVTYNGPGSDWTAVIGEASFELEEADAGWTLSGDLESLSSGFKKLTVTASSGPGVPAVGSEAYGLDIPGVVFLLKPLGGSSEIIPMVKAGECPTGTLSLNWVIGEKDDGADASTLDVLGTFTATATTATLPNRFQLDGTDLGSNSIGPFTCSDGRATVADADMYLTANGGAIVRTGTTTPADDTDDNTIVAMPGESVASGDMDGDFAGLVFTTGDTYPVSVQVSGTTVTVASVDPDTGVADGNINETITFSAFNSPATGFITATTTTNSRAVVCNANNNIASSGKGFLFCSGSDPGNAADLFSLMLIEK